MPCRRQRTILRNDSSRRYRFRNRSVPVQVVGIVRVLPVERNMALVVAVPALAILQNLRSSYAVFQGGTNSVAQSVPDADSAGDREYSGPRLSGKGSPAVTLKSWLHSLGRNHRRTRTNGLPATVETMEDRSLLSVAALFVGGELFVSSDGGDSITVQQNAAGRVEILANGAILGTAPNVLTSVVTSIVVKGGDSENTINLNEVTATTYPSVTSIKVDAGNGDDSIVGSPFFGDSILGGEIGRAHV